MFPVFRSGRAYEILFLKFSNDGPSDNRDTFTGGGLAKQPVILYGRVIARFISASQGFLNFVNYSLVWWCMHSSMRSKKQLTSDITISVNKYNTLTKFVTAMREATDQNPKTVHKEEKRLQM